MGIDLFTLIAQVINLIILLFLLRRFLYLPVLKAVKRRQKLIADEIESAAQARLKAQKQEKKCADKMHEIEMQKQAILHKVQIEADKLRDKLTEEANLQYENSRVKMKQNLVVEQRNFEVSVQNLALEYFNKFINQVLRQMADAELNLLIVYKFEKKLDELTAEDIKNFVKACKTEKQINIKLADNLTIEQKEILQNKLLNILKLKAPIKFNYEVDKNLIAGLSVQAKEQMISWNLQEYMHEFHTNLNTAVSQILGRG